MNQTHDLLIVSPMPYAAKPRGENAAGTEMSVAEEFEVLYTRPSEMSLFENDCLALQHRGKILMCA